MGTTMTKQPLKLDAIGDIDHGSLRVAMNQALKLVTQDLSDRPALNQKRKVTLKLEFKPLIDKNSGSPSIDGAEFGWQIKTDVPAIGSSATKMSVLNTGELAFHSDLPDTPNDKTLMEEAELRNEELRRRERVGENPAK